MHADEGGIRRMTFISRALLVSAVASAAYLNSVDVPFQFDDVPEIIQARAVHAVGFSAHSLAPSVQGFPFGRWLSRLTFALNHASGGLDVRGYHVVNVAIHAVAAILMFLLGQEVLARATTLEVKRGQRAATIAALFFAVHPVNTQAVTYVVQRMTALASLLGLLALWLYLLARRHEGCGQAVLAVGALLAAFLAFSTKENMVVLPGLVLVCEACLNPGLPVWLRHHRLYAVATFIGIAGLTTLLVLIVWPAMLLMQQQFGGTVGIRLLTQPRVLFLYFSLLAVPAPSRLRLDYGWDLSSSLTAPPSTLFALAGLIALVTAALWLRRRLPLATFAVAFFLVGLSIEQSVIPLDLVFEHRMYLPSFGFLLLAGFGFERALGTFRFGPWPAVLPIVALLAAGTVARNAMWRDPVKILEQDAAAAPTHVRVLATLGARYLERGDLDRAEAALRRSIQIEPRHLGAWVNLGNVAKKRGNLSTAEWYYRSVLAADPGFVLAWLNLAEVLMRQKRDREAEWAYEQALLHDVTNLSARVNLGLLYIRQGDPRRALGVLDDAVRLDPGNLAARYHRAGTLAELGRAPEALAEAEQAWRLAPGDPYVQIMLANCLAAVGRKADALALLRRIVDAGGTAAPLAASRYRTLGGH